MNTLVSFELAKFLKEKEFDVPCYHYYYNNKLELSSNDNWNTLNGYSAPTIAEVVMWLYNKYNIYIHISPHGDDKTLLKNCKWWFSIYKDKLYNLQGGSKVTKEIEDFNSLKDAYEAAIEYTLKTLI